jgi:hypothetical protein
MFELTGDESSNFSGFTHVTAAALREALARDAKDEPLLFAGILPRALEAAIDVPGGILVKCAEVFTSFSEVAAGPNCRVRIVERLHRAVPARTCM